MSTSSEGLNDAGCPRSPAFSAMRSGVGPAWVTGLLLAAAWMSPPAVRADARVAPAAAARGELAADERGRAPTNLPPEVWAKLAPQLERAAYAFSAGGRARNRAQDFMLAAAKAGLEVNGVLCLRAAALNGVALPEVEPAVREQRIEYRHPSTGSGLAVVEWYENRPEGLEQGFTVAQAEAGSLKPERLDLEIGFDGIRSLEMAADARDARLTDAEGREFGYGGIHAWDASGRDVSVVMQRVSPRSMRLLCDVRQAAFPITIDPVLTSLTTKIAAADKAADDEFACSVSVAGDIALVGADSASPGGVTYAGAAYVFERDAGGSNAWGQVAKLTASDKASLNVFGCSVSVAGDVALVGARMAGVNRQGAAYVFERNAGGSNVWRQVAKLTAADKAVDDYFGWSVSVAGNVALIGARYADPGGITGAGAAYVFERNAGGSNTWGQVAKLTASDKAAGDYFGNSVSVAGDVAVVGANSASPGGVTYAYAGAAYVFERSAGSSNAWGQVAKLTASDKRMSDGFGTSVSVAGGVALIGAEGARRDEVISGGAAYVFERNAGGTNAWGQTARLLASDRAEYNYFGTSVSVAGDIAVVGADYASPDGVTDAGACYIFERNAGGPNAWGEVAKYTAADKAANDRLGNSVSVAGEVALVGASFANPGGVSSAGAAYLIPLRHAQWDQSCKLTAADKAASDQFGNSVSVAGDVALVGAYGADPGGVSAAGAAYVFERDAGGTNAWGPAAKLIAADKAASDNFGVSVSVAGDVALVGAFGADPGGVSAAGAAHVFERNAGGTNAWGLVAMLIASDKAASDQFGRSVSVAGDVALVGAFGANPGEVSDAGAAYVFERNAGGANAWGQVAKLTASDKAAANYFGISVSVAGDVALVGAYGASPGGLSGAGAAYVFERDAGGANAWGQVAKLAASDKAASDQFGWSVSVAGDVAWVGACQANPGGVSDAGAAYVFERDAGGTNVWGQVAKLTAPDKAVANYFGISVSVAGDVALVGAYGASPGGLSGAGAAYVLERHAGGINAWGQVGKLTASDMAASDQFGRSVSVAGDVALAGAYSADPGGVSAAGAAYMFEGSLYGPPAITNMFRTANACGLSFDCQPAWRYDVQWRTNLLSGQWGAAAGLTNLPGHVSGSLTVAHTNASPCMFYRLLRHER